MVTLMSEKEGKSSSPRPRTEEGRERHHDVARWGSVLTQDTMELGMKLDWLPKPAL